jgi:RNA polymerase sigma-70 factor (ECF subfamily)
MEALAPDVTLWTDGGGKVRAALRTIHGASKVARWMVAVTNQAYAGVEPEDMRVRRAHINGVPGIVIDGPHGPITTITLDVDDEGRVTAVQLVANPDKLGAIGANRELAM